MSYSLKYPHHYDIIIFGPCVLDQSPHLAQDQDLLFQFEIEVQEEVLHLQLDLCMALFYHFVSFPGF